jgi:hypothetical protein
MWCTFELQPRRGESFKFFDRSTLHREDARRRRVFYVARRMRSCFASMTNRRYKRYTAHSRSSRCVQAFPSDKRTTTCAMALLPSLRRAQCQDRGSHWRLHRRHRHQEFLRFLRRIDQETPTDVDVTSCSTTMPPISHRLLCVGFHGIRFNVHFTPTSSSWSSRERRNVETHLRLYDVEVRLLR